jgi:hypothetical protein
MKKIILLILVLTCVIQAQRYTSKSNSTTTLLSGGASFTGTATKAMYDDYNSSVYNWINVTVRANQSGSGAIQQSKDGISWQTSTLFTYTANDSLTNVITIPINLDYFRVVYTNGASAQTGTWSLTTVLTNGSIQSLTLSGGSTAANQIKKYVCLHDTVLNISTPAALFSYACDAVELYPKTAGDTLWYSNNVRAKLNGDYLFANEAKRIYVNSNANEVWLTAGAATNTVKVKFLKFQ